MPEGPEVEAARALIARCLIGLTVVKVTIADDTKIFAPSPEAVKTALVGKRITGAKRKGKYMWIELDGHPCILFHLGMTGGIAIEGVGVAKYKRVHLFDTDMSWPPKFTKLEAEMDDGTKLAFADARRFGKVVVQESPETTEPVAKLGFDVISGLPTLQDFKAHLGRYQRPKGALRIKALLLDQAFSAGVGNWVADEVLFQARVHPEQPVAGMPEHQVEAIHRALQTVLQHAVSVDADSEQFPKDWLFHYRWTGKKAASMPSGHRIEFVTVGSRTSAFVPAVQKIVQATAAATATASQDVTASPEQKSKPKGRAKKKAADANTEEGLPSNDVMEGAAQPAKKKRQRKD